MCAVIMTAVVLFFSISVFANVSNIVCVGPDTVGEAASEAGSNPCNLQASIAERDVPVGEYLNTLTDEAQADTPSSEPKDGSDSGSVQ